MRIVVTLGDQAFTDLARDVRLGPPDERPAGDLGDDPVGGVGGLGQQRDLVGVLDDPQLAQDRRGELELRLGEVIAEPQQMACREVVRDRDPERATARLLERARTIEATRAWASSASSQVTTGR